ncbi:hypothetical protein DMC64_36820 [Amycolatopsis sp. WAC 04197]|uniref:hypothetical protein n=1 Tax=Amycolatopsis sp. WAC 04197 TaxID=2203199 RepID=UPI000F7786FC|nr:hypothetical protein [Amycolatopsis sp. WAC 04197]RSN39891.1 hypothetical protein DMC64_36820 [Amycolatopsis sp. WAC 04197]
MSRAWIRWGSVTSVAVALMALAPGVAAAAGPGEIDVCNHSTHGAYVSFPWRAGMRSTTVPAEGVCVRFRFDGDGSWEQVDVVYADNPDVYIGSFGYTASRGAAVAVYDSGQYIVQN